MKKTGSFLQDMQIHITIKQDTYHDKKKRKMKTLKCEVIRKTHFLVAKGGRHVCLTSFSSF